MDEKRLAAKSDPVKTGEPVAPAAPTVAEYSGLQAAFEHFNAELFASELPDVMIVLTRRAHSAGHFSPDRFATREGGDKRHELSLNPDAFFGRTDKEIMSTEVHEMVHVLQTVRGTGPMRPYHNKDFAAQMKVRGLYPSNTGTIGGKETGAQMSHFIIPGGAFERSYERLHAKGWKLGLESALVAGSPGGKKKNKTTFTCAYCGENSWGRKDLFSVCGRCLVEHHPSLTDVAEAYRMTERQPPGGGIEPVELERSELAQAAE